MIHTKIDMKIKYKDAAVVVEKGVVISIKAGYRAIRAHPFLAIFVLFLYLLHSFLPVLFGFLVNSAPVILCTTLLLGTLLSYGNPNIPEIDEEEEEEKSAQDHDAQDRSIGSSLQIERSDDVAVIQRDEKFQAEGDGEEKEHGEETTMREGKVDDVDSSEVVDGGFGCASWGFDDREKTDSCMGSLHGLSKKPLVVSGVASDSDSGGEESSSPDASMADILPLLDELHPFFNTELSRPVRINIDDTDDTAGTYSEDLESDSSSEEDASETQELLEEDKDDDDSLAAMAWNADDLRNFTDLKSSELERNQRLENLIEKRKAGKVAGLGNFIDLDQSTLDRYSNLQISHLSTRRRSNPFDDDPEESNELPPIPSSAPSVLSNRNIPFEFLHLFMHGLNFPSYEHTSGESLREDTKIELAQKDCSKLSPVPESESDYTLLSRSVEVEMDEIIESDSIPYSSLPPIETSNIDATLREPLLSPDRENLEQNIVEAYSTSQRTTTSKRVFSPVDESMAEFDVIPDYLMCDVLKIAEPPLDESGVQLPTDLSADGGFKIITSLDPNNLGEGKEFESLLSELDAVGDFSVHQSDQMFQHHSDSDETGSDSVVASPKATIEVKTVLPEVKAQSPKDLHVLKQLTEAGVDSSGNLREFVLGPGMPVEPVDNESDSSVESSHSNLHEPNLHQVQIQSVENIDSVPEEESGSSLDGTHQTSEVHSELHEAGDTHFVLIHDRELIDEEPEKPEADDEMHQLKESDDRVTVGEGIKTEIEPTEEHTEHSRGIKSNPREFEFEVEVEVDGGAPLPEDMDVALKRLFRQNTIKMGLEDAESEKQQEDLHWELRRLFRQNTSNKGSKLAAESERQQEEDFLSALKMLFKENTFIQEIDNDDDVEESEKQNNSGKDDDDVAVTTVQDMHLAMKRLFRQFSVAPERCNELEDDKSLEIEESAMVDEAEASPCSKFEQTSEFDQTSSEFVEIVESREVASDSEHKQTDKLIESLDIGKENAHSENDTSVEVSQLPTISN